MTIATPKPIILRPEYQLPMVRDIAKAYQEGAKGVILRCPTGGGKTRTASYIVNKYASTGRQVLWIVDQEELVDQAAMTFAEYGIEHHMLCSASTERAVKAHEFMEFGRSWVKHGAHVVIASIQTLVRRLDGPVWSDQHQLKWLNPAQIVADEADLSLAATWRRVIGYWPEARLLGLTATPVRMDRQSFARHEGGLYDQIVHGPTEAWLIDNGFLANYDAYKPEMHLQEGVADLTKRKGHDYDPQELEKELDAPRIYGDVVAHYRTFSHGKPAIAFCPTVASAEKFARAFRDGGYRALALDGMTEDGKRRKAIKQLGNGEMDVLTGVGLLVKGVDIPYATTAIWLRKTMSLRIFMQGTGRVLRPHPQKDRAIILDCVGVIEEHGLPHFEREWSLSPEAKKTKAKAANDNEQDVKLRTCPSCASIHVPLPVCPNQNKFGSGEPCGYVYPVAERREAVQVDANLVKVNMEEEERQRRQRRAMQGQAQSVEELMGTMGMSRSRATKIVAARQAKARVISDIMDVLEPFKAQGGNVFKTFGCTLTAIRNMKPKELQVLRAKVVEHVQATSDQAA